MLALADIFRRSGPASRAQCADRVLPSHLAAMAADEQGKFWAYHDKLFANQPKI